MSHYEKVLKACDIVWFVSSACNFEETLARVRRVSKYRERATDVLQGAVVRRPD